MFQSSDSYNCSVPSNITEYQDWIRASQSWAWILTSVGCLGNLFNIMVIIDQWYIGYVWGKTPPCMRRQNSKDKIQKIERPALVMDGHTILLLHLCFCDFIYCVVNLPLTVEIYEKAFAYNATNDELDNFCKPVAFFRHSSAIAEWLTLGLLSLQRCVDLNRWESARFFRARPTVYCIVGVWASSLSVQAVPFIEGSYGYCGYNFKCDIKSDTFKFMFFAIQPLVPAALMLTGCTGIICQLRKHRRELQHIFKSQCVPRQTHMSTIRPTVFTFCLLLFFFVCVIPICVYSSYSSINGQTNVSIGIFLFMIYWLQYAFNFVFYMAMSRNFRKAYCQFFRVSKWLLDEDVGRAYAESNGIPTICGGYYAGTS